MNQSRSAAVHKIHTHSPQIEAESSEQAANRARLSLRGDLQVILDALHFRHPLAAPITA